MKLVMIFSFFVLLACNKDYNRDNKISNDFFINDLEKEIIDEKKITDEKEITGKKEIIIDDIIIDEIFYSPNNTNKIEYVGVDRFGIGTFYKDTKDEDNEILTTSLYAIGPRVNWYGDYIAEIYIYSGPGFNSSYFYLFNYDLLTPKIYFVLYVLPDMELVLNSDDTVNINIRSLITNEILQIVKIDGIIGSPLSSKNFLDNVTITDDEIILSTDCEPYTYKILSKPILYKFKRSF